MTSVWGGNEHFVISSCLHLITRANYPKECHGAATLECPVAYLRLAREILGILDGRNHALDREKRRQIGRVRGDDDQRKKPPCRSDDPGAGCLRNFNFNFISSIL
jgi:hypothetical protein